MQSMLERYRSLFVNLDSVIHLAACSQSPLSLNVRDAIEKMKADILEFGNPWDIWVEKVNESKRLFAEIIHAKPENIAVSSSVSAAFSSVMSSLKFEERNGIVVTSLDYPTTNFIALANEKNGARVFTVHDNGGKIVPDDYRAYIN